MTRLSFLILIISALVWTWAHFESKELPSVDAILKTISEAEPEQLPTKAARYEFSYAGRKYLITPLAEYSIQGLVVSHNNIHSIADMYHDRTSVDIKDLCILWGSNVASDVYLHGRYWNGSFHCAYEFSDGEQYSKFRHDQLSNNHILARNLRVRRQIQSIRIGDQVSLSGKLIKYSEIPGNGFERISSLIRTDTGNGACEVFMVDSVKIFKRGNQGWNKIKDFAAITSLIFLVLSPVIFIASAYIKGLR